MNEDNRNLLLAIAASVVVMVLWQLFVAGPEAVRRQTLEQQVTTTLPAPQQGTPAAGPGTAPSVAPVPTVAAVRTREQAIAASGARVAIETPSVTGSIALRGGRIDDLVLRHFRVSTAADAANVVLFSPTGTPEPYYAEFGWVAADTRLALPTADTVWTAAPGQPRLTSESPVTLRWDNGAGLIFHRTISVDANYMFTFRDEVENRTGAPVALNSYALISRHGTPKTAGFFILHEGMIGVMGDQGLKEIGYGEIAKDGQRPFSATGGWLGITDKYWAAALVPPQNAAFAARFSSQAALVPTYQTDYLLGALTVAPGARQGVDGRLFAGAKQVPIVDGYEANLGIKNFELMIDWGWFHFITKPMFYVLDYFYKLVGNFGVSILIVTILAKLVFFPLQNRSYETMSKMRLLQPEMTRLRERFKDDKMRQQQELMALYKKQKLNPLAGCLPLLLQIPVFFALYKVLFVTIEMRHAPFFGWIRDLSAPDPTNLFNLFGLLPFDPTVIPVLGPWLHLGVWPILMGVTMLVQMRLNPTPPDPIQQVIFTWMPVLFTFMLATFPAGLVIYWTWNNLLSIAQQAFIMKRQSADINLLDNILPGRKPAAVKSS